MNEKGLVANLLYLAEADYGEDADKPPLSIGLGRNMCSTITPPWMRR